MPKRPPELRSFRIAVYCVFGLVCALAFFQLLRSVVSDLYGRTEARSPASTPAACLDELDRLYQSLAARAVEPAPTGLDQGSRSSEWDLWSRRWEADVDSVSRRCDLFTPKDPAMTDLADALSALEELRRELSRSGVETSADAGRARDALASARARIISKSR